MTHQVLAAARAPLQGLLVPTFGTDSANFVAAICAELAGHLKETWRPIIAQIEGNRWPPDLLEGAVTGIVQLVSTLMPDLEPQADSEARARKFAGPGAYAADPGRDEAAQVRGGGAINWNGAGGIGTPTAPPLAGQEDTKGPLPVGDRSWRGGPGRG